MPTGPRRCGSAPTRSRPARECVGQHVGVGRHDGVAHLDSAAVGVVGGADQVEDGDAGGQAQGAGLVGHRHAGADFLVEAVQDMPGFLKPGVDPAGSGVGLLDGGAVGDVQGDIRGRGLDRAAVEKVAAVPGEHLAGGAQAAGDVAGGAFLADDDAVHARDAAGLLGLGDERGLAGLAVAAGEPVGGESPDRGPGADEHAAVVLGQDGVG